MAVGAETMSPARAVVLMFGVCMACGAVYRWSADYLLYAAACFTLAAIFRQ
jgi:hypothetical protein